MQVTINIFCIVCGNQEDFLEIDCLDYEDKDSYEEFYCQGCGNRIKVKVEQL